MFCGTCGKQIDESKLFCEFCGASQNTDSEALRRDGQPEAPYFQQPAASSAQPEQYTPQPNAYPTQPAQYSPQPNAYPTQPAPYTQQPVPGAYTGNYVYPAPKQKKESKLRSLPLYVKIVACVLVLALIATGGYFLLFRGNGANSITNVGNIVNGGLIASEDGWTYFIDNYYIYKMRADGTEKTKITDDGGHESLTISDGWIYCNNYRDGICKMRTDGTEKTVITDVGWIKYLSVVDGWVYYSEYDNGIYKVRADGTEKSTIAEGSLYYMNVVDGWIYYYEQYSGICKVRIDGTGKTTIEAEATSVESINVVDGWVYYASFDGIFKISIDGKGSKAILEKQGVYYNSINVVGGWIYYCSTDYNLSDTVDIVGKVRINGNNNTILFETSDNTDHIHVVDGYVYFSGYNLAEDLLSSGYNNYRVDIDGKNVQRLEDMEINIW